MYRLLLVEDDIEICEIIQFYLLRNGGYELSIVHNGEAAMRLLDVKSFDGILMDIMLPGEDGIHLCARIRQSSYCPILFISCFNDDETIIRALNMGGDDYIPKPFQEGVLLARIEACLRRSRIQHAKQKEVLRAGALELNPTDHSLYKGTSRIPLSPTEFEILYYMFRNQEKLLRFEDIYKSIWDRPSLGDLRTLFVHIRHLRQKLEDDPAFPVYIKTQGRDGYIFCRD